MVAPIRGQAFTVTDDTTPKVLIPLPLLSAVIGGSDEVLICDYNVTSNGLNCCEPVSSHKRGVSFSVDQGCNH